MIGKIIKYLFIIVFVLSSASTAFAEGEQPIAPASKNGNFKKSTFSKNSSWSKNGKSLAPPDPGGGGGGNRIPISGGLGFLMLGSALYLMKKVRDENA